MYVTEEIRRQVRLQKFRDALSGVGKAPLSEPDRHVSDFGVSEKVDAENTGDFTPLVHTMAREEAMADALAAGDHEELARLENIPATDTVAPGNPVASIQKLKAGGSPDNVARIEAVTSHKASVQNCDYLERQRHVAFNTVAAHDAAMDIRNNADPQKHDVNAVQMMMENIFDWEYHAAHNGETMTPPMYYKLAKSLRANIVAACPVMKNDRIFDHFEMLANRFMGDFMITRNKTQQIVEASLMAQIGNEQTLNTLRETLGKTARFYERFYPNSDHKGKLPMKAIANAMERHADRGGSLKL
jgi:hypothetical protein